MEEQEVPYGKISGKQIIRNSWRSHPDRIIGEIKDDDIASSIQYFENKFEDLRQKLQDLKSRIESADNKGSFYMQLMHLKEQIAAHDGLGDYAALEDVIDAEISLIEGIIKKNRERNTEIKNALLRELSEAVDLISWQEASEKIKDIRHRWIKTGQPNEDVQAALENDFQEICQDFYNRRQSFFDDRARLAKHHENTYLEIIEEAKKLDQLVGKQRFEKIKALKQSWTENGPVAATVYQPLFKQFQLLTGNTRQPSRESSIDLQEIIDQLENSNISFKEAKQLQNQLKNFRPKNESGKQLKQKAFHLIHVMIERSFLLQLVEKRFKNYRQQSDAEQQKSKQKLLRELIDRDKKELEIIEMNLEKFNTRDPKAQKMMNQKLLIQKQKISVKEQLLNELKG